ncbi:MAG: DUF4493 domain-containing protein [Rikenellaceae bacterium]
MKSILKLLILLLTTSALYTGCKSDDSSFTYPDNTVDPDGIIDSNSVGYLTLSELGLTVEVDLELFATSDSGTVGMTRADSSVDIDSFTVKIYREDDGTVAYEDTYKNVSDLTDPITLSAGAYYIDVYDCPDSLILDAGWYCPHYKGSERCVVGDEKVTTVEKITCTLSNVMVSVTMSADFKALFNQEPESDDDILQVILATNDNTTAGVTHELTFYAGDEGKAGYFKAPDDETMKVYITGLYNAGTPEAPSYTKIEKGNWVETITGVKAGQYRNVEINIKIDQNAEGSVEIYIDVKTWAYDTEVNVDITATNFLAAFMEDVIFDPDDEVTAPNSPVLTLDGLNVEDTYIVSSENYDEIFGTYSPSYKAYITPTSGSSVESIDITISSTNSSLMSQLASVGFSDDGEIRLYENGTYTASSILSSYLYLSYVSSSDCVVAALLGPGYLGLSNYSGTHTIKVVATDSENRTSYTTLTLQTQTADNPDAPIITWDGYDFETTYQIYTDESQNPEVVIEIESQDEAGITGMILEINSEILTEDFFDGSALSTYMDLVNASDDLVEALDALGLPSGDAVKGQTLLSIDISIFLPMLAITGNGYSEFTLTVSDAKGTSSKTIKLTNK